MENTKQIIFGNARFTVITENLIRAEYADGINFMDNKTLFASNRSYNGCPVEITENDKVLTIKTEAMTLTFIDDGRCFSAENLTCDIFGTTWHYGDKNEGNIGGTLATLDGVQRAVPLEDGLLSTDGWFVIDDSKNTPLEDGWIKKYVYGRPLDIYIFGYGKDYKKALKTLAYVSGKVALPRKYVFGSWYSRWWPYSDKDILGIVDEYDANDFPLDIMVLDMDWHYNDLRIGDDAESQKHRATDGYGHGHNIGWTGYTWNEPLVGDHKKLLKDLHERDIYVTLNDHPADGIRTHEDCYADFMRDMGVDPACGINLEFDAGSKKYMDAFYKNAHTPLEAEGVDFWWVDWQQDWVKPCVKGTFMKHLPWLNYCYYHHAENEHKRGLSFSRWGGFGDQKHPIYFSGDMHCTWDALKFEVEFTSKSSNVLAFYWGHDTGGFCGERNPEMYARWTQFSAFSATLRVHSACLEDLDRCPWKWGDEYGESMRRSYHMRSRLIPYIYSLAYRACEETLPPIAGMYIEYPEKDEAYQSNQQYMFGPAFIVAPITSPADASGMASQKVWLPEDGYYNYFTGERYESGQYELSCNLNEFPLFVKGGVPIPMQPYTKRMTSTPLTELDILCYPGEDGSFTLYEDDGITRDFENGAYLKTELSYHQSNDAVTIDICPEGKGYDGMPQTRKYVITLPQCDTALTSADGTYRVTFKDGTNTVEIPEQDVFKSLHITLHKA